MRIVFISDTHERHGFLSVPDGDVLVHCGDFTMMGEPYRLAEFNAWFGAHPHKHKLYTYGNHELTCDPQHAGYIRGADTNVTAGMLLNDSGCEIDGVKFWGSPIQPAFNCWAFNRERGADIKRHWDMIPDDTDVLVTHGPPFGHLDAPKPGAASCGCHDLSEAVKRVRPKIHAFGHIHGGHGMMEHDGTTYINAASVDEMYRPTNKAIVFDF